MLYITYLFEAIFFLLTLVIVRVTVYEHGSASEPPFSCVPKACLLTIGAAKAPWGPPPSLTGGLYDRSRLLSSDGTDGLAALLRA